MPRAHVALLLLGALAAPIPARSGAHPLARLIPHTADHWSARKTGLCPTTEFTSRSLSRSEPWSHLCTHPMPILAAAIAPLSTHKHELRPTCPSTEPSGHAFKPGPSWGPTRGPIDTPMTRVICTAPRTFRLPFYIYQPDPLPSAVKPTVKRMATMAAKAINRNDPKSTIDAMILSEIKPKDGSYVFRKDAARPLGVGILHHHTRSRHTHTVCTLVSPSR